MKTTLTFPEKQATPMPVNPSPAAVSYTSAELSLWQQVAAQFVRTVAIAVFEQETGKAFDGAFLI